MSSDISNEDYQKICKKYPELAEIGFEFLGPKIWILFNALKNGSINETSIAHNPCASLMENHVDFGQVRTIMSELVENGLLVEFSDTHKLSDRVAYTLQQLSFDLTQQLRGANDGHIKELIRKCGYSSQYLTQSITDELSGDDNNKRSSRFKELMSEVAYSGLKLLVTLMNKTTDNIS
ncbi:MAG: hypothetical protein GKS07_05935 [Nitrosopumilus sp.]|nr:MAG: hypothetical protein GKS07_05935 [Nitrosopumilus sp.]